MTLQEGISSLRFELAVFKRKSLTFHNDKMVAMTYQAQTVDRADREP